MDSILCRVFAILLVRCLVYLADRAEICLKSRCSVIDNYYGSGLKVITVINKQAWLSRLPVFCFRDPVPQGGVAIKQEHDPGFRVNLTQVLVGELFEC